MRQVALRTSGRIQGPIRRLVSPDDIGRLIKPFVFLDLATPMPGPSGFLRWHPHSGIATVTVIVKGAVRYQETTGASGELRAGAVEWMASGKGVWHTGAPIGTDPLLGLQLWVALGPELEGSPPASQYVDADTVPNAGPARVILGAYEGAHSPVQAPPGLTYLDVRLGRGETWRFAPPAGQTVAWLAVHEGSIGGTAAATYGELVVFGESEEAIEITARTDVGLVLGAAVKSPHELHIGPYSVHSSADALRRGEAEIGRLAEELRARGVLS
ncbi:MAG: pirin family protein [Blastomonas sp.]